MSSTDSPHTKQIKRLVSLIGDYRAKNLTLMRDAKVYFASYPKHARKRAALKRAVELAETDHIRTTEMQRLRAYEREIDNERLERLSRVNDVSSSLLALTEGHNEEDTLEQSAKSLGTTLLITQGNKGDFAKLNETLKPFYKAILTLRLSDAILAGSNIRHPYLSQFTDSKTRFFGNRHWQQRWMTGIARPLIKAAMLQDIGLQHPKAQRILLGADGKKDPFRVVNERERKALLKINYHGTLNYLVNGLGLPGFVGDTEEQRDIFFSEEKAALEFCKEVVSDAFVTKNKIGELIKIPQIYASFVLSTKPDYSKSTLPKGYLVIEQLAKSGALNRRMATQFLKIVGYFPQGYGISYLPVDANGFPKDQYEYAIVNRLYPSEPSEPHCRAVTRKLSFVRGGQDIVVSRGENLYFQSNHKKISSTSAKRIEEIMSKLSGDFSPEDAKMLVPRYWEPHDYFADRQHQNLWTKQV